MTIADVGGANSLDTSTLDHKVDTAPGWYDPVQVQRNIVPVPGGLPLDLGGATKQPRIVRIIGWISGTNRADLDTNFNALMTKFRPGGVAADVEISFPDDANVILVGQAVEIDTPNLDPTFIATKRRVTITFEAADPHRYDISGGRPGTALS